MLDIATDESKRPASSTAPVFAIGPTQVHAFDVATPSYPLHLGTLNLPYRADGVAADGERVYVGTRRDGLIVIDAADPTNMLEIGRFVPDDHLRLPHLDYLPIVGLDAAGDLAAVAIPGRLLLVDVSDPRAPRQVWATSEGIGLAVEHTAVEIVPPWVYAATSFRLHAFHIADPSRHGQIERGAFGLDIVGQRAYAAAGAVAVLDVSDPTQLALLGTSGSGGTDQDVRVEGELAFVASGDRGLALYDIRSSAPQFLFALDTPGFARRVRLAADGKVVADGSGGMRVFETVDLAWRVLLPAVERSVSDGS